MQVLLLIRIELADLLLLLGQPLHVHPMEEIHALEMDAQDLLTHFRLVLNEEVFTIWTDQPFSPISIDLFLQLGCLHHLHLRTHSVHSGQLLVKMKSLKSSLLLVLGI